MRGIVVYILLALSLSATAGEPKFVFLGENNAADSSENALSTTVTGTIYYNNANEYQGAYCFFPDNGRIFTSSAVNFADGAIAVSMMMKSSITGSGVLFGNSTGSGGNGFYVSIDGVDNKITLYTCDASLNVETAASNNNVWIDNTYFHLIIQIDRENSKARFFVNNVNVTTDSIIQNDFEVNDIMSFFSNRSGTGLLYGSCFIDNIQGYGDILSYSQRDSLYQRSALSFVLGEAGGGLPPVTSSRNRITWFNNDYIFSNSEDPVIPDSEDPDAEWTPDVLSGKVLYVDITGSSSNDGLTESTPVTIADVESKIDNTFDFIAISDTTHYGTIAIVNVLKSYGDPLVLTTWVKYNSGSKAQIKGLTKVSEWTQSGNYWTKTGLTGLPKTINRGYGTWYTISGMNGMYIDGAYHTVSRYPNGKTYLAAESLSGNNLTDNQGIATADYWNGGTLVSEGGTWINGKYTISDYASGTFYLIPLHSDQTLYSTSKYFVMNHHNASDVNGEFTNTTSSVEVYHTENLNEKTIYIPLTDSCLSIKGSSYVTIKNIDITGANKIQLRVETSLGIRVESCDFHDAPLSAIALLDCDSTYITNNNINGSSDNGITGIINNYVEITDNVIENCGVDGKFGGGRDGMHLSGIMLQSNYGDIIIERNIIDSTGYCGIDIMNSESYQGNVGVSIKNNWVNSPMMVVSDGAGIYTFWFNTNTRKIVRGNLVTNVYNNTAYHYNSGVESYAIYMDEGFGDESIPSMQNRNWLIDSNTVFDYCQGFFNNRDTRKITWRNNVLAKSVKYASASGHSFSDVRYSNIADSARFVKNKIVNGTTSDGQFIYFNNWNAWNSPTTEYHNYIDSNDYYNPFNANGYVWLTNNGSPDWTNTWRTLIYARSISTWEDNSTLNKTGWDYTDVSGITEDQFIWLFSNQTATAHSFSLGSASFYDLDHNAVSGTLTLDPYESKVLFYHTGSLTGLTNPSIYR